jgi:mono/diheme cytochrome c family protein
MASSFSKLPHIMQYTDTFMRRLMTASVLVGALLLGGCRGMKSERPPIHPNLNMDIQNRFDPQEANPLFADNAAMRKPPAGTVARGLLQADSRYFAGRTEEGEYVDQVPVPVNRVLLERGQERYEIFCTVCHGAAGDGNGIIMTGQSSVTGQGYGYTPAPTYHSERLREVTDGYIYDVVANGVRNMPGYAQQIPVADRWAIVAYVRALQRSQNADAADVPQGVLSGIQPEAAPSSGASDEGDRPAGDN